MKKKKRNIEDTIAAWSIAGTLSLVAFALTLCAAWVTHVVVAISVLTGTTAPTIGYGILLIIGVLIPPVGVIHGAGVWFGAW